MKFKLLLTTFIIGSMVSFIGLTNFAMAQPARDAACKGVQLTGGSCDASSGGRVSNVLKRVIDIFSMIVGIAAIIMIIVGGLKYITSAGDATSVNSAKNTILYAVVGLVIVALAQVIVRFVIGQASG